MQNDRLCTPPSRTARTETVRPQDFGADWVSCDPERDEHKRRRFSISEIALHRSKKPAAQTKRHRAEVIRRTANGRTLTLEITFSLERIVDKFLALRCPQGSKRKLYREWKNQLHLSAYMTIASNLCSTGWPHLLESGRRRTKRVLYRRRKQALRPTTDHRCQCRGQAWALCQWPTRRFQNQARWSDSQEERSACWLTKFSRASRQQLN